MPCHGSLWLLAQAEDQCTLKPEGRAVCVARVQGGCLNLQRPMCAWHYSKAVNVATYPRLLGRNENGSITPAVLGPRITVWLHDPCRFGVSKTRRNNKKAYITPTVSVSPKSGGNQSGHTSPAILGVPKSGNNQKGLQSP